MEQIYFHASELRNSTNLQVGSIVTYSVGMTPKGQTTALQLQLVETPTNEPQGQPKPQQSLENNTKKKGGKQEETNKRKPQRKATQMNPGSQKFKPKEKSKPHPAQKENKKVEYKVKAKVKIEDQPAK